MCLLVCRMSSRRKEDILKKSNITIRPRANTSAPDDPGAINFIILVAACLPILTMCFVLLLNVYLNPGCRSLENNLTAG